MNSAQPDFPTLKARLEDTWSTGDYGLIARGLERSAEEFLGRAAITEGSVMLDLACGAGQVAIPAARMGARVTGLDLAPPWIAMARTAAAAEGLDIRFDVGDAESMPYEDGAFDVVISLIGVMFAPRPAVATAEMLRVCRPGGRIVLGNWTPEGFIGTFFRTVANHVPPPDMPSPLLWGTEETVRERFGERVARLAMSRRTLHFDYPMSPADLTAHYMEHFGPTRKAVEALDGDGRASLARDIEALWSDHNQATDGSTQVDAEILEVVATK